ncbi:MAG: alpha/beta hydrolase [bacterium]|nr:alpha/beta hydrolase [bacterium]
MSWLFLLAALVGAWFTWNAYRPTYRPAPLAVASFFAGWLTTELALHHLAWQLAATLVFVWLGALDAWPGQVALAVTFVSWGFLWRVHARAWEAEAAVEDALSAGLGPEYRSDIDPGVAARFAPGVDWGQIVVPFPIRRGGDVERIRNVVYSEEGGHRLRLDVYRRRDRPMRAPTLLQIHGGGWVLGSKNEQGLPLMLHLARRGWVCVSADYRLSPRATFPDPLIDVKRALAWVRSEGVGYGADPDCVVITGGSAGGHLASLAALTPNDPAYQPGFEAADTRVQACVAFYGVYDFTDHGKYQRNRGLLRLLERQVMKCRFAEARERWERASPFHCVGAEIPPFFVIHGDHDTLVPVGEARAFAEALQTAAPGRVCYAEIPGAQHAFEIFPSLRTTFVVHGVERFLAWVVSAARAATPPLAAGRRAAAD